MIDMIVAAMIAKIINNAKGDIFRRVPHLGQRFAFALTNFPQFLHLIFLFIYLTIFLINFEFIKRATAIYVGSNRTFFPTLYFAFLLLDIFAPRS